MILGLVVEGSGDEAAAPVLVRRLAAFLAPGQPLDVARPFRVARHKLVRPGELERVVDFMARRTAPGGRVLVLIDSDDNCPAELGPALLARAKAARPEVPVAVVLAKHEFEAWFLAGANSLRGCRTLREDLEAPANPEGVRGAKEWLDARMQSGYSETLGQAAFAARLDLTAARRADSFDKLVRDLATLLAPDDEIPAGR